MPLWNTLRSELDRAGKAAQHAIDEGKIRLEILRARQFADKAAQALGYAVHRTDCGLQPADESMRQRLLKAVQERLDEVSRLEALAKRGDGPHTSTEPGPR